MSKHLMRVAMWTELREALRRDYPELNVAFIPTVAVEEFIIRNADYVFELSSPKPENQKQLE